MLEADFSIQYNTARKAASVREALAPDNVSEGSTKISVKLEGNRLLLRISGCTRIETLQATLQDLFRCIGAAEASLNDLVNS